MIGDERWSISAVISSEFNLKGHEIIKANPLPRKNMSLKQNDELNDRDLEEDKFEILKLIKKYGKEWLIKEIQNYEL